MSKQTVARWIREEGLPAVNLGSELSPRYRVSQAELDAWLNTRRA